MSFTADLTEEQLTVILKKGIYSDLGKVLEEAIWAESKKDFEAKVRPLIKQKVEGVIKQLTTVTTGISRDPVADHLVINVLIK